MSGKLDMKSLKSVPKKPENNYERLALQVKKLTEDSHHHRTLQKSILTLLRNFDSKLETMKHFMIRAGHFTEQEYCDVIDEKLGLRVRDADEVIVPGDIVYAKYHATVKETGESYSDPELPVRVGTGAVIFEEALIGKYAGAKGIEYEATFKEDEGEMGGKHVSFVIDVLRVKTTSLKGEPGESGSAGESGIDGNDTGDAEAQESVPPDAEGLGNEEGKPSDGEPVL